MLKKTKLTSLKQGLLPWPSPRKGVDTSARLRPNDLMIYHVCLALNRASVLFRNKSERGSMAAADL